LSTFNDKNVFSSCLKRLRISTSQCNAFREFVKASSAQVEIIMKILIIVIFISGALAGGRVFESTPAANLQPPSSSSSDYDYFLPPPIEPVHTFSSGSDTVQSSAPSGSGGFQDGVTEDPTLPQNQPLLNCQYDSNGAITNTGGDCYSSCDETKYLRVVQSTSESIYCCCE